MGTHSRFQSPLARYFEDFIALRRACGAAYGDRAQPQLLRRLDRYLAEHWLEEIPLSSSVIQSYFDSLAYLPKNSRANPIGIAWKALSFAAQHGAPIEDLPTRPELRGGPRRNRERYIFAHDEVARLRKSCCDLRPRDSIRPQTYDVLFGLLYATGVRINEALNIAVKDLDSQKCQLFVSTGKFRKERLLPIRASTARALSHYLQSPKRPISDSRSLLFLSRHGAPLTYQAVRRTFRKLLAQLDIQDDAGALPRIHDLRFTFAAHCLQGWYRDGRDVDVLLPALSTYLGHVDVEFTLLYLKPAAPLLREASDRFERSCLPSVFRVES